eukprot:2535038-Amphidinium_carterae.4
MRALLRAGKPSERTRFMDCWKVTTRLRCRQCQATHWVSTPRSRVVIRGGGNPPARQTFIKRRLALKAWLHC